jgi:hypothetical protein
VSDPHPNTGREERIVLRRPPLLSGCHMVSGERLYLTRSKIERSEVDLVNLLIDCWLQLEDYVALVRALSSISRINRYCPNEILFFNFSISSMALSQGFVFSLFFLLSA